LRRSGEVKKTSITDAGDSTNTSVRIWSRPPKTILRFWIVVDAVKMTNEKVRDKLSLKIGWVVTLLSLQTLNDSHFKVQMRHHEIKYPKK